MQVLYLLSYVGSIISSARNPSPAVQTVSWSTKLERETGLEPATLSLEG